MRLIHIQHHKDILGYFSYKYELYVRACVLLLLLLVVLVLYLRIRYITNISLVTLFNYIVISLIPP